VQINFTKKRKGRLNPSQDVFYLALLLWKPEALSILEEHGIDKGFRSKPQIEMIRHMCGAIPHARLKEKVRNAIKMRGDWRVVARRKSDDGLSLQPAKSLRFRDHLLSLNCEQ